MTGIVGGTGEGSEWSWERGVLLCGVAVFHSVVACICGIRGCEYVRLYLYYRIFLATGLHEFLCQLWHFFIDLSHRKFLCSEVAEV